MPIDQFIATNSGDKVFTIRIIRLRGGQGATENLLLNPGGPGVSGVEWFPRRAEALHTIVGDGFHLLAFDPEGSNRLEARCDLLP